ncbi:MAG: hypothetical protein WCR54_00350 [Clostridia bacterium]
MYVEKTTEIKKNEEKNDIYFQQNENEISFYHNEFLLFKHTKKSPLISIILKKGNAEKEIPLQKFEVKKIGYNDYYINFYNQIYHLNLRIKQTGELLKIEIKNTNKYPILKTELNNSSGRIRGLGLNKYENCNNREFFSNEYLENQKKHSINDKILTFIKKKKYFFSVIGSFEWRAKFTKRMDFYIKNAYYFNINIVFGNDLQNIHDKLKANFENITKINEGKVIECRIENVNERIKKANLSKEKISAIILNNDYIPFWELFKFEEKYRKSGIKIIVKIMPKISIKDDYISEFVDEDFITNNQKERIYETKDNDKFVYFNLSNQNTCRKVKNYIRRIFGTNVDGVFSVEKENDIYNTKNYLNRAVGMSQMWQTLVYEASKEYYIDKILIFDKLTSNTPYYGYYLIPYKKAISIHRKKIIKNLRNSGVFNLMVRVKFAKNMSSRHIQKNLKEKVLLINK